MRRNGFGALRKLPSGLYQASYIGRDGARHAGTPAPRRSPTAMTPLRGSVRSAASSRRARAGAPRRNALRRKPLQC